MDLDLLLNTTSDGISVTDSEGNFTFFNRAHCQLFGYTDKTELLGRSWRILYNEDEVKRLEEEALKDLNIKGHWQGLINAKRRDGSLFLERLSLSKLADGGILCLCNEFAEDLFLNSKLGKSMSERSEDMERRGRLFSLANHEMRAPLSSISLASQLLSLESNMRDDSKRPKLLQQIREQVFRAGELMDKFLFLGCQFSGALPYSPRETDLRIFLENFDKEKYGLECSGDTNIACTLDGEFSVRLLDPILFKHCLGNLLSNAVKFRKPDSTIELHLNLHHRDRFYFSVRNEGPVPEPDTAANLFEPFFRCDYSGFPAKQGSGLGLYIVLECVKTHGGDVRIIALEDGVKVEGFMYAPTLSETNKPLSRCVKSPQS
jgi:PAS domain S-box-containing protein